MLYVPIRFLGPLTPLTPCYVLKSWGVLQICHNTLMTSDLRICCLPAAVGAKPPPSQH